MAFTFGGFAAASRWGQDRCGRLRPTLSASGGGDDGVQALLDEAAVRFDFSQYDDVDNMVDVNGGWGPLVPGTTGVASSEFTVDGLRRVAGAGAWNPRLKIEGTNGPMEVGPNGFTYMQVLILPAREPDTSILSLMLLACDSANNFAPSTQMEWELSGDPENPDPEVAEDLITVRVQEGEPDFTYMANVNEQEGEVTPLATAGVFILCVTCDVDAAETRYRAVCPGSDFSDTVAFPEEPTFATTTTPVDYIQLGTNTGGDERTYVEFLGWNRAFTPAEVDALVTHFTA